MDSKLKNVIFMPMGWLLRPIVHGRVLLLHSAIHPYREGASQLHKTPLPQIVTFAMKFSNPSISARKTRVECGSTGRQHCRGRRQICFVRKHGFAVWIKLCPCTRPLFRYILFALVSHFALRANAVIIERPAGTGLRCYRPERRSKWLSAQQQRCASTMMETSDGTWLDWSACLYV